MNGTSSPDGRLARLRQEAVVVDTHGHTIDLAFRTGRHLHEPLDGLTDAPLMRAGGITTQIAAIILIDPQNPGTGSSLNPRPMQTYLQMVDLLHRELAGEAGQHVLLATSAEDILTAKRTGKVGLILGMEGADPLQGDLSILRILYRLGLRHVLLTHEGRNQFATAHASWTGTAWRPFDPEVDGPGRLTPLGRELVREMNRLGMLVDVSHLAQPSFWDVVEVTTQPIIATHSNARALPNADCERNLTDEQIRAIAQTGGLVCCTAMRLCQGETSSLETLLNQIDYVVGLVGIEHVGFGTDFGRKEYSPPGLEDAGQAGNLIAGLLARGYNDDAIINIVGGNFVRLFRAVVG